MVCMKPVCLAVHLTCSPYALKSARSMIKFEVGCQISLEIRLAPPSHPMPIQIVSFELKTLAKISSD